MEATGRYSNRYKLAVAAVVTVALGLFVAAVRTVDTDDSDEVQVTGGAGDLDKVIEAVLPRPDTEALQQTAIVLDLAPGYDGGLAVNGVVIPEGQLERDTNVNLVRFVPADGRTVEELPAGRRTCVDATYWPRSQGRTGPDAGSFRWCFDVT